MTTCPICGSNRVEIWFEPFVAKVPYGPTTKVNTVNCRCLACNTDGDFGNVNDALVMDAQNRARNAAIGPLLDAMNAAGIADLHFERVFGIKFDTLKKWRTDGCTPAEFALAFIALDQPGLVVKLDERRWWNE